MANQPFDQEIINPLERPLSSDINQLVSQVMQTQMALLRAQTAKRSASTASGDASTDVSGFIADGLKVRPQGVPAMSVVVTAGMGMQIDPLSEPTNISGIGGLNNVDPGKPLQLNANKTFTVPANVSGSQRIDLIEVKYARNLTDSANRNVLNPGTGVFTNTAVNKTLSFSLDNYTGTGSGAPVAGQNLYYKQGTPGSGSAPAVDSGYLPVAAIYVDNGATSIDANRIADLRTPLVPNGIMQICGTALICTDGSVPNALGALLCQPGVQATVIEPAVVDGQLSGTLIILPGALPTGVEADVGIGPIGGTNAAPADNYVQRINAISTGALSSGDAADMVDITKTGTPLKAVAGAPSVKIGLRVPTGFLTPMPAQVVVNFEVRLRW